KCWSSEMPTMTRPWLRYWSCSSRHQGASIWQGPHQVAQKSSTTGWPANCDRLTGLPSTSLRVQLGAARPMTLLASRISPPALAAVPGGRLAASFLRLMAKYTSPPISTMPITSQFHAADLLGAGSGMNGSPLEQYFIEQRDFGQVSRHHRELLGQQQESDQQQQHAGDLLDPMQVAAETGIEGGEAVEGDGGEQEGHGESSRIHGQQEDAVGNRALVGGQQQNRRQHGADAGGPAEGEGEAHREGAQAAAHADALVHALVAVERANADHAKQMQSQHYHDQPAALAEQGLMRAQRLAERGGFGAQGDEDHREPEDEVERVADQQAAAAGRARPRRRGAARARGGLA